MKNRIVSILIVLALTSCNNKESSKVIKPSKSQTEAENIEEYKSLISMLMTGNIHDAIPYFAEDISLKLYGFMTIEGKPKVVGFFKEVPYDRHKYIPRNYIIDGNTVAVEGTAYLIDENGKTSENFFCDIYKFENSKIKELSSYFVLVTNPADADL